MPRLSKVTKELNVGLQTCVDFLQKKGHTVDNSLNAKISDEQYELLVIQFSSDKDLRLKAEKAQRERLDSKKEAKPSISAEPQKEVVVVEEPARPSVSFKVVGKIELDTPKKEESQKVEPVVEEDPVVVEEAPTAPVAPVSEPIEEPEILEQQEAEAPIVDPVEVPATSEATVEAEPVAAVEEEPAEAPKAEEEEIFSLKRPW